MCVPTILALYIFSGNVNNCFLDFFFFGQGMWFIPSKRLEEVREWDMGRGN